MNANDLAAIKCKMKLKKLKSAQTFLSRWNGGEVCLRELTVSLKSLTLQIIKNEKPGELLIICGDPLFIHSPVRWKTCSIEIVEKNDEWLLTDVGADCSIRFTHLEVIEHQGRTSDKN